MMSSMGKHEGVLGTIMGVGFDALGAPRDPTIGGTSVIGGMGIPSSILKSRGIKPLFCPYGGS